MIDDARYIGRYLDRSAIAEYRILYYDGKVVRFWYVDHKTEERVEVKITAEEFIGKLVIHMPTKSFKMVRRYVVYAGNIQ